MPAIFELPARNIDSPSPSNSSSHSVRKARFDDRAQASIKFVPRQLSKSNEVTSYSDVVSDDSLRWNTDDTINEVFLHNFSALHGDPILMEASGGYVAVGTSKGEIIGFNNGMKFVLAMSPREIGLSGSTESHVQSEVATITCIAFSADSQFLASGYSSGSIILWNLSTSSPHFTIRPISLADRFTENKQGHLSGVAVTQIKFLGASHSQMISCDLDGLVFYHYGLRRFLQNYFVTQKLLGGNDSHQVNPKRFMVHDIDVLPLGTSPQITDQLGVVAVITSSILLIVSVLSIEDSRRMKIIVHYKIGRPSRDRMESPSPEPSTKTGTVSESLLETLERPDNTSDSPGKSPRSAERLNVQTEALLGNIPDSPFLRSLGNPSDSISDNLDSQVDSSVRLSSSLKVPKSSSPKLDSPVADSATPCFASLNWFPCMDVEGKIQSARLVYAWNSTLTVLEVNNAGIPKISLDVKDKDKGLPSLGIKKKARWMVPESASNSIRSCKWLSAHLIAVFLESTISILYYSKNTLNTVGEFPSPNFPPNFTLLDKSNKNFHSYSISSSRNKIFVMTKDEILVGRFLNWADNLGVLLAARDYSGALHLAQKLYTSRVRGELVLVGLPFDTKAKNQLLKPYLLQIMRESIVLFESDSFTVEHLLKLYLNLVSLFIRDKLFGSEVIEELLALLLEHTAPELFFTALEEYVLVYGNALPLPPVVLKALVQYYAENGRGETLTEILCLLDLSSLDIDLTVALCRRYRLRECYVYVWSKGLGDYGGVLEDFVEEIAGASGDFIAREGTNMELSDSSSSFQISTALSKDFPSEIDDFESGSSSGLDSICYTYISYILTGRQYPTDIYIPAETSHSARKAVCSILFASSSKLPVDSVFPNLFVLLHHNSFLMLSSLNEFFEDPVLNDDNNELQLSRQYITDALLDIYETNKERLCDADHVQLAIFIGRNYPKYPQFIRLSESTLTSVVNTLVYAQTAKEDCELALQSLLPHTNIEPQLISQLRAGKFYAVLMDIYGSEGRYAQVVDVWLKRMQEGYDQESGTLVNILEKSLALTKNPVERLNLIKVIKENYTELLSVDLPEIFLLVDKYAPELHEEILNLGSDPKQISRESRSLRPGVVLEYLRMMFSTGNHVDSRFIYEYVSQESTTSEDIYEMLLKWHGTLEQSGEYLSKVMNYLQDNEYVDSLVFLMVSKGLLRESLDIILKHFEKRVGNSDNSNESFKKLLLQAMDICDRDAEEAGHGDESVSAAYKKGDIEEKDEDSLWLTLCTSLIVMSQKSEAASFLNSCIHDCFRRIGDSHNDGAFLDIFNRILNKTQGSELLTTMANIRGILQEVFVSYSYESEMLSISLAMLNQQIYSSMDLVRLDTCRGWNITQRNCSSCTKVMWGSLSEDHYHAWSDRKRQILYLESESLILEKYHQCELIFFKCGHGYHSSCLDNFGGANDKSCVICKE